MTGKESSTIWDVLDFNFQTFHAFGKLTRSEELLFTPAAIAGNYGVLGLAEFAFGTGIAVNTGIAAGGVPLAHILPFTARFIRPDPHVGTLVWIKVVKFAAQHHA